MKTTRVWQWGWASVLVGTLLFYACDSGGLVNPDPTETPTAMNVRLDSLPANLTRDDTVVIHATVLDENGNPMSVSTIDWSTSDPKVATVEPDSGSSALLAGQDQGTATITASYDQLSASKTIKVHRRPTDLVYVSGSGQKGTVGTQLPDSLVVRAVDRRGDPVSDVNISFVVTGGGGSVSPAGGYTDANGMLSATWTLGSGLTQQVQARASEAQQRVQQLKDSVVTYTATTDAVVVGLAVLPDSPTVNVGDSLQLEAIATTSDSTQASDGQVTWATTDTTVATVNPKGLLHGRKAGRTGVIALTTQTATGSAMADTTQVTVASTASTLGTLTISSPDTMYGVGSSQTLTVQARAADGSTIANPDVQWSSLNPQVATVDSIGRVTAQALGTALITATSICCSPDTAGIVIVDSSTSATGTLTVASPDTLHGTGDTLTLSVVARAADGSVIVNPDVQWNSLNPDIASVDTMGRVTAVALGTALITATAACCAPDSASLIVADSISVSSIAVSPASTMLQPGDTQQFDAVALMSDGSEQQVAVTWAAEGGSVTSAGLFTAGSTNGTYQVTATDAQSGLAGSASVFVQDSTGSGSSGRDAILDAQYPTPTAPAPLRTFYVDASAGSDSGAGTQSDPWRTLDKVTTAAQAGDLFYLRGTFNAHGSIGFSGSPSGTASHPIVLKSWPGSSATLASSRNYPTIWLKGGMNYWWFEGLRIQRGSWGDGGEGVLTTPGSNSHTFIGNVFESASIHLVGSSGTRIYQNQFVGTVGSQTANSGDAIFTQNGSDDVEIVRNAFTADVWHATMTIGSYQSSGEADCLNTAIIRNYINNTAAGGMNIQGKSVGAVIAGNDIKDVGTQGVANIMSRDGIFFAGRNANIYWNRIWNAEDDAIKIQAYVFAGFAQLGQNNHIYNNTFFHNGGAAVRFVLQNNVNGLTGNIIENNIFWRNDQRGTVTYGGNSYELWADFYHDAAQANMWSATDAKGNIVRNNLLANTATPDGGWLLIVRRASDGDNTSYSRSAAEANLSGWSANIEQDPLFLSESTPNLHLQSASPCVDAGRSITGMAYLGNAPDMGAYEDH